MILHPSSFNYRDIPKGADFSDNDFVRHFETLVEGRYYIANAWTKIVRREIIIKNNLFFPKGYIHEDFPYSLQLARFIKTFAFYDNPFYQYRVLGGSIGHNIKYKNFSDVLTHLDEDDASDFYREDRIHHRIADIAPARTAYAVPGNQGRLSEIFFGISFRQTPNRKRAGRNSRPAGGDCGNAV